jgi:ssDNA-binding Zn-finger/Zn-ribbon topoisomerase 1
VVADAVLRLGACGCTEGCPLCTHLGNCLFRNEELSKASAAEILQAELSVQSRAIPEGSPGQPTSRTDKAPSRRPVDRPCPKCGRPFAASSWAKGNPYGPHNRIKGDPSHGVCGGAPAEGRAARPARALSSTETTSIAAEPSRRRLPPGASPTSSDILDLVRDGMSPGDILKVFSSGAAGLQRPPKSDSRRYVGAPATSLGRGTDLCACRHNLASHPLREGCERCGCVFFHHG